MASVGFKFTTIAVSGQVAINRMLQKSSILSMMLLLIVVLLSNASILEIYCTNIDHLQETHRHRYHHHHHHSHNHHHQAAASHSSTLRRVSSDDSNINQSKEYSDERTKEFVNSRSSRDIKFVQSDSIEGNQYLNDQPMILDQCCACDEAKYELVFEGLWSRYTHPEEFPENYWLAHFSDIIGASHNNEFRMWANNSLATEGVKELAENGSTKKLEFELKQVSSKTRTIIKARELKYPTLNTKTSAVFRTDRQHHLVSMLSKLGPSPDWMVGVSALELCQQDCSWVSQRIVNLYLWDAGTDSGTNFMSPDMPTKPQGRIHPFKKISQQGHATTTTTTNSPRPMIDYTNNYDSYYSQRPPKLDFQNNYDALPTGGGGSASSLEQTLSSDAPKPFARLTVTRQRIYEKSCNGEPNGNVSGDSLPNNPNRSHIPTNKQYPDPTMPPIAADCRFTEWSDWSSCSSTCGRGIRTRTRAFIDENAQQAGCSRVDLIEKKICLSECIGNATCVTEDWTDWSRCSVNCGQGYRRRTRAIIESKRRACDSVELAQFEPCNGAQENCSKIPSESLNCELTEWSRWSDCSVACGKFSLSDSELCRVQIILFHHY